MSWKRLPDGKERLEAFLREARESDASPRPTDASVQTPRSRKQGLRWIFVPALVVVAVTVWLLW